MNLIPILVTIVVAVVGKSLLSSRITEGKKFNPVLWGIVVAFFSAILWWYLFFYRPIAEQLKEEAEKDEKKEKKSKSKSAKEKEEKAIADAEQTRKDLLKGCWIGFGIQIAAGVIVSIVYYAAIVSMVNALYF